MRIDLVIGSLSPSPWEEVGVRGNGAHEYLIAHPLEVFEERGVFSCVLKQLRLLRVGDESWNALAAEHASAGRPMWGSYVREGRGGGQRTSWAGEI